MCLSLWNLEGRLAETAKEACGIDPALEGFPHNLELVKLVNACQLGRVQSETKQKINAVARAHGEPVTTLAVDWEALFTGFKQKFGVKITNPVRPHVL